MADKPGFLLYFETAHALENLSAAQRGNMFSAMAKFAEYGEEPDFSDDAMLALAWKFVEPRLIQDDARYKNNTLQRQYAAFVRERKKLGLEFPSFEIWKERPISTDVEEERPMVPDESRFPSATPTPAPAATPTPAAAAAAIPDPAAALLLECGISESVAMRKAVEEDISTHGKEAVADALRRAADADTRGGVSVNFYRAILNGQGQPRHTSENNYLKRNYDDAFFKSLEVNLDEL